MKHVRMFVIILLVSAVATVYGKERHGTETGTAQLSIYKLPPLERAIRCTKYYEGWHGEKKHWPYVGWGHNYPNLNIILTFWCKYLKYNI